MHQICPVDNTLERVDSKGRFYNLALAIYQQIRVALGGYQLLTQSLRLPFHMELQSCAAVGRLGLPFCGLFKKTRGSGFMDVSGERDLLLTIVVDVDE